MENLEKAIEKLNKYGQGHIIKIMEKFTDEEKEKIAKQINEMDFDNIEHLYNSLVEKKECMCQTISPISALKKNK